MLNPVRQALARGSLAASALGLYVGKGLQMGAGFIFWVIAARSTSVLQVGIAVAAVSAVMLCTQLGLLGTGSAVTVALGRDDARTPVLDTAFTLLAVASVLVGATYVVLTVAHDEIGMTRSPVFIAVFLAAAVFGAAMICLDQVWVALGRGGNSAARYAFGGVASVVALSTVAVLTDRIGAVLLFACWACGTLAATLLGAIQLRRLFGYRYRPALSGQRVRRLLGIGLPNHLLTLTERAPGLLIPVLVAHAVSPRITAYWYPAWMMAWIVFTAPVQVGLVQFSEGVRRPDRLAWTIRHGIRWSLLLGGGIAVVMFVAAHPLLRLLGAGYADASVDAVRILTAGLVPYACLQAYGAVCRARGRLAEGIAFNTVLCAGICTGVVLVARQGPTMMALVWLACSAGGAVWAVLRVRQVLVGNAADG